MTEILVKINGTECKGKCGETILEFAQRNGIHIPNMCAAGKKEAYGACGLCLVQVEGMNKLVRACATKLTSEMAGKNIVTENEEIFNERKQALELLISEHSGDCIAPCKKACPGETDCQGYVGLIANGFFKEAVALIKESYPIPSSLGRICPHPCETKCRRALVDEPIAIASLKEFVGDFDLNSQNPYMPKIKGKTDKNVSVIGAGPAGLTFGYLMALEGHNVTIYDMMENAGGMLYYGIPEYRLPKDILNQEIEFIEKCGVKFVLNTKVDTEFFNDLQKSSDVVFLATGAWKSTPLRLEGENLQGVYGGIDFLRDVALGNKVKLGKKVAIIGGGNTAIDTARTAIRLGTKDVTIVYRRTREEMPAEDFEIEDALKEGVKIKFLSAPVEIIGKGDKVKALKVQQMELGEADASGRRRPIPVEGAYETIEVTSIIGAIGQKVDMFQTELDQTKWGTIIADENSYRTNIPNVFAGGDMVNDGPSIAIVAISHGQKAFRAANAYLNGKEISYKKPFLVERNDLTSEYFSYEDKMPRVRKYELEGFDRTNTFAEVTQPYLVEQALNEASRCLECGCSSYQKCSLLKYSNDYDVTGKYDGEKVEKMIYADHPFIYRDGNKCVLCGNCITTCENTTGLSIFGIQNRGYEAEVLPAFSGSLMDTNCISCGNCIDTCPTGALQARHPEQKEVPLPTSKKHSVCTYCGLQCELDVNTYGNAITNITSENPLCLKGRFGYPYSRTNYSLMPRLNGRITEYSNVLNDIVANIKDSQEKYGKDSVALFLGARLTNEELYMLNKLGQEHLGGRVYNANVGQSGLKQNLGIISSTATIDDVDNADLILVFGSNINKDFPVLAGKIRVASKNGAKLCMIQSMDFKFDDFSQVLVEGPNTVNNIMAISKALLYMGYSADNLQEKEQFIYSLENVIVGNEATDVAQMLKKAKNPLFIYDHSRLSLHGEMQVANLAAIAGKTDRILQLQSPCNQLMFDILGLEHGIANLVAAINRGDIKGLIMVGHDLAGNIVEKLDWAAAFDVFAGAACGLSRDFLPLAGFGSVSGSYINYAGKVNFIENAIEPIYKSNIEMFNDISAGLGGKEYKTLEDIRKDLVVDFPILKEIYENKAGKIDNEVKEENIKLLSCVPKRPFARVCTPSDNSLVALDKGLRQFGLK